MASLQGQQGVIRTKNVILLGTNGHTSQEIIPRLLEQDDVRPTRFLRRTERLQRLKSDRVQVAEGDARKPESLRRTLRGQDIVISTMGGMDLGDKMETLGQVMEELGAPRLIASVRVASTTSCPSRSTPETKAWRASSGPSI